VTFLFCFYVSDLLLFETFLRECIIKYKANLILLVRIVIRVVVQYVCVEMSTKSE